MKMKSIKFNSEMVNAILEGRKTQTRRVIKDVFGGIKKKEEKIRRIKEREGTENIVL